MGDRPEGVCVCGGPVGCGWSPQSMIRKNIYKKKKYFYRRIYRNGNPMKMGQTHQCLQAILPRLADFPNRTIDI